MKYRIMLASSGYYFVQHYNPYSGWRKIGGFFRTRLGARDFARNMKYGICCTPRNNFVEYV